DPEGRQLGERGLLGLAQRLAPMPPEDPHELLHALLGAVSAHSAGDGDGGDGGGSAGAPDFAASDDVTVLILRPNGLRPRLSIAAHLKATARMAGEVIGSLQD